MDREKYYIHIKYRYIINYPATDGPAPLLIRTLLWAYSWIYSICQLTVVSQNAEASKTKYLYSTCNEWLYSEWILWIYILGWNFILVSSIKALVLRKGDVQFRWDERIARQRERNYCTIGLVYNFHLSGNLDNLGTKVPE